MTFPVKKPPVTSISENTTPPTEGNGNAAAAPAEQKPYQAPPNTNNTMQRKALAQQKMLEKAKTIEQEYKKSDAYEQLHTHYAGKFPDIGKPDGKPLGLKFSEMQGHLLTLDDLKPGDIIVSYEPDEKNLTFASRSVTLSLQKEEYGNGFPASINQGDYRNVHNAIYTHMKGNPEATEAYGKGEPPIVEGRGARIDGPRVAPGDVMRVQPSGGSSVLHHHCKIYRPTNQARAEALAQVAMSWAAGSSVEYSKKELSSGGKGNYELTSEAKETAVKMAKQAFDPVQGWAVNPTNMADQFREGVNCTSFIGKIDQVAQLNMKRQEVLLEATKKGVDLSANDDYEPARFENFVDHMDGLGGSANPANTSVRLGEHFLLNAKDADGNYVYEFVGKLEIKPEDIKYDEKNPPSLSDVHKGAGVDPGTLPSDNPQSTEFQEAERAKRKQAKL